MTDRRQTDGRAIAYSVSSRSLVAGGLMASTEREPITGVWGEAPSGVQGHPWSEG